MNERREFCRVRVIARVRVEPLEKSDESLARARLASRRVDAARAPRIEDAGATGEWRQLLDMVGRIAVSLERIERRLGRLESGGEDAAGAFCSAPVEIDLSASGFAFEAALDLDADQLALVELDMPETGLPPIAALARFVAAHDGRPRAAFHFEQIHPEDLERVVQLGLRVQSQELRSRRSREETS